MSRVEVQQGASSVDLERRKQQVDASLQALLRAATLRIFASIVAIVLTLFFLVGGVYSIVFLNVQIDGPTLAAVVVFVAVLVAATLPLQNYFFRLLTRMREHEFISLSLQYLHSVFSEIIQGCAELDGLSRRLYDKSDRSAQEEARELSVRTLKRWEDYRETYDGITAEAERYLKTYQAYVISSLSGSLLTIIASIFVVFQILDLFINLLQYSRYPNPYDHADFFLSLDRFVVNNLFGVLSGAAVVGGIGLFVVLVVVSIGQVYIGRALRTVIEARNEIVQGAPPNEEIRQAISKLIGSLIRQNYELADRFKR